MLRLGLDQAVDRLQRPSETPDQTRTAKQFLCQWLCLRGSLAVREVFIRAERQKMQRCCEKEDQRLKSASQAFGSLARLQGSLPEHEARLRAKESRLLGRQSC